jgi:hypothetical protein
MRWSQGPCPPSARKPCLVFLGAAACCGTTFFGCLGVLNPWLLILAVLFPASGSLLIWAGIRSRPDAAFGPRDAVIQHPFWKNPLTSAELQKIAADMRRPGVRTVAIDDRVHSAALWHSSPNTLPAEFSQRVVWVRCNHLWDLPRVHGELKARLDVFVKLEAAKNAPSRGNE